MARRYRVTVVFDTREQRESPDAMRLRLGQLMESLGATVEEAVDLGPRNFARCANRRISSGSYAGYTVSAPPAFCGELTGRLRLDKTVNRTLVECI
ncbi:MAG: 30S ribosomal protein S6 [Puniceicoccales bacterium]|nr:30S ribosomal protein S6 [Puniceicoccales bacterium]